MISRHVAGQHRVGPLAGLACVYKTAMSYVEMKKSILGIAALSPLGLLAQSDPTVELTSVITTDWPLVMAAGVTVMIGVIAMAIVKKFRKVT